MPKKNIIAYIVIIVCVTAAMLYMAATIDGLGSPVITSQQETQDNKDESGSKKTPVSDSEPEKSESADSVSAKEINRNFITYNLNGYNYVAPIVEIENTGTKKILVADAIFDVEDSDGHLLTTAELFYYPVCILPGERGYIFAEPTTVPVENMDDVNYVLEYGVYESYASYKDYEITDVSVSSEYDYPSIVGRVNNDTDADVDEVSVFVAFYNSEGVCIGLDATIVQNVPAKGKKSFQFESYSCLYDDIDTYSIKARIVE